MLSSESEGSLESGAADSRATAAERIGARQVTTCKSSGLATLGTRVDPIGKGRGE